MVPDLPECSQHPVLLWVLCVGRSCSVCLVWIQGAIEQLIGSLGGGQERVRGEGAAVPVVWCEGIDLQFITELQRTLLQQKKCPRSAAWTSPKGHGIRWCEVCTFMYGALMKGVVVDI